MCGGWDKFEHFNLSKPDVGLIGVLDPLIEFVAFPFAGVDEVGDLFGERGLKEV